MRQLYFGGNIVTMKGTEEYPEALVTDQGKIIYIGNFKEAKAIAGENRIEIYLGGKTLMPAFIDSHSHFMQVAQNFATCDLSEAKNFKDIVCMLTSYLKKEQIDENGILFGSGYDHNFLEEGRHPDKDCLDQVSDRIPIYISHVSGHMGVANSALLKISQITPEQPDPNGGKFGRREDGSLSGYIEETPALMRILMSAIPRIKMNMKKQLDLAQDLYLSYGITTAQEGAISGEKFQELAEYAASLKLKIDVIAYMIEDDYTKKISKFKSYDGIYKNRLKIGGAKIILDGSPQGKSAWLSKPYEGEQDNCGYGTHTDDYVEQCVKRSIQGNYQLLAHCNGDAASDQFLKSYEKALKEVAHPNPDLRPVIIHSQILREDQLDKMKELRIIPSIFIGHTYYWGDVHLKNLGLDRGSRISPIKSAAKRGLIYNFHQDSPVTKPDMLHSVWCAVNRMTRSGRKIGEDQCIDVYDALKGVTIHAAYEYHEENVKGTLEIGKLADMVILDQNPLKVDKKKIKDITIMETIKNGTVCYTFSQS